jgi:hypothetical protein
MDGVHTIGFMIRDSSNKLTKPWKQQCLMVIEAGDLNPKYYNAYTHQKMTPGGDR